MEAVGGFALFTGLVLSEASSEAPLGTIIQVSHCFLCREGMCQSSQILL